MYSGHSRKLVVYWLCDDIPPGTDAFEIMIRSLIRQLLPTSIGIPDFVREFYEENRSDHSFPRHDKLTQVFRRLVQQANHDIYIILDDISHHSTQAPRASCSGQLFNVVRSLVDSGSGNIHVLLSVTEEEMAGFTFRDDEEKCQLFLVRDLSCNPDLEDFQEYRLRRLPLATIPRKLETAIRNKLAGQAEQ